MLKGAAACERASARILHARGRETAARRAERCASRIGLTLDEPVAVRRMQTFVREVLGASHHRQLLERALDGAMSLSGADLGNVALRNPATGALRIVVQRGFGGEYLEHFAAVDAARTAGERAAGQRAQSMIVDVDLDPGFAEHRSIAAAAGFRAVQATPLIDDHDRLRGIISTHFRQPHRPGAQDLQIMAWYGELTARALTAQQSAPTLLFATAVARHESTADRHNAAASVMRACAQSLTAHGAEAGAAQARAFAHEADARAFRERERAGGRRRLVARGREAQTMTA